MSERESMDVDVVIVGADRKRLGIGITQGLADNSPDIIFTQQRRIETVAISHGNIFWA